MLVLLAGWYAPAPAMAAGLSAALLSPAEVEAQPRRPVTLSLELTNAGPTPLTTTNTLDPPAGWSWLAMPETSELAPGEAQVVFFTLNLSGDTPAGSYPVTLIVTPADAAPVSVAATVRVAAVEQLTAVVAHEPTQHVLSGAEFNYEFLLTNLGNAGCTAYLELEGRPAEWELSASATELQVASGASATLTVTVTAPEELTDVTAHRLTLKVHTRAGAGPEDEPAATVRASARVVPRSRGADTVSMYAELEGELRTRAAWDQGEELETQQGLELGGGLGAGRDLRISGTLPSLTDSDMAAFSDEARGSLIYGDERWGYAALGDHGVNLGAPLLRSNTNGRGGELTLRNSDGELRVFYAYPYSSYDEEVYGVHLSAYPAADARLSLTALNEAELKAPPSGERPALDTRGYSVLGEMLLGGGLYLVGEAAQSERKDVGTDTAWRAAARYRGDDFGLGGEYVRAGPDYLGAWQDEEFYRGDLSWSPADGLRLWSNYTSRRENIDDRPGLDGREQQRLQLGTSFQLGRGTSLRVTRNLEDDRDVLAGTWDERTLGMDYELSSRWENLRLGAGWYEESLTDRLADTAETRRRLRLTGDVDLGRDSALLVDLSTEKTGDDGGEKERTTRLGASTDFAVGANAHARLDVRHNFRADGDATLISGEWRQRIRGGHELILRLQHNTGAYGDSTAMAVDYLFPLNVPVKMVAVRGAVTGRLYKAHDPAQGLAGVLVSLGGEQVVSAEDGSFSFPGVEPGEVELNVSAGALGVGLAPDIPLPHALTVVAGETTDVQIPVVAAVLVGGKVVLTRAGGPGQPSTTAPLPEAVVELVGPEKSSFRLTDGAGRFLFGDLRPGAYTVLVRPEGIARFHEIAPESIQFDLSPGEARTDLEFIVKPEVRAIQVTAELGGDD